MNRLYIAAKAPRAGFVKTRLAREIGEAAAVELYLAFLRDLAARFAGAPLRTAWFITPDDSWDELARQVGLPGTAEYLGQGPGNWAERQDRLFTSAFATPGGSPVVLIGSDSPQLSVETITDAFRLLEGQDVVVVPTVDGGYSLIGMRRHHDLLAGISMSTPNVLQELLGRAAQAGLRVGLLEPTFDVDQLADLPLLEAACALQRDLSATRQALVELGHRRRQESA